MVNGFLVTLGKDGGCQLGRTMGTFLFLSHIQHRRSCRSLRYYGAIEAGGLALAGCDMA